MKKFIILTIISLTVCCLAQAQAQHKLEWGVKAAWNISYPVDATRAAYGVKAGIFGQLNLTRLWCLDAELRLSHKPWYSRNDNGLSWNQNVVQNIHKYTGNPFSLELPIHAGIRFNISSQARMFVAVGPYFGMGLFGKGKATTIQKSQDGTVTKQTENYNIFGNNHYASERFEVGIDGALGIEIRNHYRISAGYLFQFNDPEKRILCPVGRAQVFSIDFGYKF